ncbi:hypothetical protein DRQ33_02385 [bacterium]|nr:MAG: hypothetical protein DRQ33_02385 [bacterium]
MFKKLFELWHKEDLLHQALKDAVKMLELAKALYEKAVSPLEHFHPINPQQIYDMDQQINTYEVQIRRKVLEHLSISPQQDTTAALVLTTITVDIERIGDYAKNFTELWELYGSSLDETSILARLKNIHSNITKMFDDTISSFGQADVEAGRRVMESHIINSKDCEEIIAALIRTPAAAENYAPNQEVMVALAARYFKRISAHLKNIASSVVNPFDRIGYKPESYKEYSG